MRNLSTVDHFLSAGSRLPGLLSSFAPPGGALGSLAVAAPNPSAPSTEHAALDAELSALPAKATGLSEQDRKLSGGLMRVNHVGEVCAQALYEAQARVTKNPQLRDQLLQAAEEERRHLMWVEERLNQLGEKPSMLNPVWFGGAYGLGMLAGLAGDRISLGFVAETEKQVEAHLAGHLERLPGADLASRQIVDAMRAEEAAHGRWAQEQGGVALIWPIRMAMKLSAKLMTSVARHI